MMYRLFRVFFRCFFKVLYRYQAYGLENIPRQGPVILCSNHISLLDPPFVGTPLERRVCFMAKAELFKIPIFGWAIRKFGAFPVQRGGVSRASIRHSLQLLLEGKVLGIFPEGSRSNMRGAGQKGAASLALRSQATVIPTAIIGQFKLFRRMVIAYGEPIDLSAITEHTSHDLEQATELIMNGIRRLQQQYGSSLD